jgi:hypothetical protein
MKQTAVEWLFKNLLDTPISNEDIIYNISVFEEAKKMEKQQMIEMHDKGFDAGLDFGLEEAVDYSLEYKEKKK